MVKKSILPSVHDPGKQTTAGSPPPERRDKGRLKLQRTIRVRPSVPGSDAVEEILETLNISRQGLYFRTASSFYYKGMRLFITYPYSSAPEAINLDYIAKVLRVDLLPNGVFGVAVELSTTLDLEMHTRSGCI
jgi:hypothetical protein